MLIKRTTNKTKYKDIYDLISKAGYRSDYVKELHSYTPMKYTIKISKDHEVKRFYSISIFGLWIEVSEYINAQRLKGEQVLTQ